METRRDFLRHCAAICVYPKALYPIISGAPRLEGNRRDPATYYKEILKKMGINGDTVLTVRNLQVTIHHLNHRGVWNIVLSDINAQMANPEISFISDLSSPQEGKEPYTQPYIAGSAAAIMPYVTGHPARYVAEVAVIDHDGTLSANVDVGSGEGRLASYLIINRYYDNKIVNVSLAVRELIRSMIECGIGPGEEFSYLDRANISGLIESGEPLMGYGISEKKLVQMYAGGICSSVSTIARMARQAEYKEYVEITRRKSHSVPELRYFFNPDDPTPEQIDATAYSPNIDFRFRNPSCHTLYVVPKLQIIPDESLPANYNGLEDPTGFLVLSTTLQVDPPTKVDLYGVEGQLETFRRLRGI